MTATRTVCCCHMSGITSTLPKKVGMQSSPSLSAQSTPLISSMPPLPPGPAPSSVAMQQVPPPIAQLLYREGDAWTALLSLHSSVVQNIQALSTSIANETFVDSDHEKELQYCTSLSQAAAQCDALHAEIIKIRTIRKARSNFDMSILQPILSSHSREAVAAGSTLASQASVNLQGITSELRISIQEMKRAENDLSTLHDLIRDLCPSHSIPSDFKVTVAIGDSLKQLPLSDFIIILNRHCTYDASLQTSVFDMKSLLDDRSIFGDQEPTVPAQPVQPQQRRMGDKKR